MTAHKKARTNGREDSGFRNRLTEGSRCGNLVVPIQDSHSVPHNPTYLANAGRVVSSRKSPWARSVNWDWMVSRVKVKSHPSIKPSVKRLTAKMTSMAPKSMKTVIRLPVLKHGLGMGAFNFTFTKEHIGER